MNTNIWQNTFILFLAIVLFSSCAKEEGYNNDVPYARVVIDISYKNETKFDNAYYYKKYYSGQNEVVYGGYVGVLAISLPDPSSGMTILRAYDLCCPYEGSQKNELKVNESNWTLQCPKCKSAFSLMYSDDGRAVSAPASTSDKRLKRYSVYKDDVFYKIRN